MYYDVVIIGGGPAGMSAAHELINNNISCIVIDKQIFPRNKLCAGGVTKKTMELLKTLNLGEDFNGNDTVYSNGASIYLEYNHIVNIKCEDTYLVDRFEFDDYLVKSYKNKGGIFLDGIKVLSIDTKESIINLSDGRTIEFKYIIGADGAVGITRSLVDKDLKTNGFCLQIDINKEDVDYEGSDIILYYGVVPYGYGWIFPKKDYVTVGFITEYNKEIDFKNEFEIYLSKLGILCDSDKFKGAFVPYGKCLENPINKEKNLLLVGDSAGFVDPITGEGIYFAVLSGLKAANVITKVIQNNNPKSIEEYIKEVEPIVKNIHKGNILKKLVYKYKKQVFALFKNKSVANILFNKHIYNSNYRIIKVTKDFNKK